MVSPTRGLTMEGPPEKGPTTAFKSFYGPNIEIYLIIRPALERMALKSGLTHCHISQTLAFLSQLHPLIKLC